MHVQYSMLYVLTTVFLCRAQIGNDLLYHRVYDECSNDTDSACRPPTDAAIKQEVEGNLVPCVRACQTAEGCQSVALNRSPHEPLCLLYDEPLTSDNCSKVAGWETWTRMREDVAWDQTTCQRALPRDLCTLDNFTGFRNRHYPGPWEWTATTREARILCRSNTLYAGKPRRKFVCDLATGEWTHDGQCFYFHVESAKLRSFYIVPKPPPNWKVKIVSIPTGGEFVIYFVRRGGSAAYNLKIEVNVSLEMPSFVVCHKRSGGKVYEDITSPAFPFAVSETFTLLLVTTSFTTFDLYVNDVLYLQNGGFLTFVNDTAGVSQNVNIVPLILNQWYQDCDDNLTCTVDGLYGYEEFF